MVSYKDIEKANTVLADVAIQTPMLRDSYLSDKYKANIYLKQENVQKVRSFKLRGAYYAIHNLSAEQLSGGVVCASAGNHAQGVAYTCQELNIKATIFMPTTTPQQKITQVKFFGGDYAEIALVGDTFDESAAAARDFADREAKTFIDPFDNPDVIAGQGTVAVEIFDKAEQTGIKIDKLFAAVGGGGLISGVSLYAKHISPSTKVIGVEATGARSMQAAFDNKGPIKLTTVDKFADGIAVQKVGHLTYQIAEENIDDLINVDEGLISSTILDLYSKQGMVVEPAGAASVAALNLVADEIVGQTVVCIISGGNNDINRMQEIEEKSLIYEGLKHYFVINFPQRPGALREFVNDILGPNDDITRFEYIKRANKGSGPVLIGVVLADKADQAQLKQRIADFDPGFIDLKGQASLYNLLV
ncbi:threonine ammonia-lyase IlvA [Pseudolactococcus piscium]|uniref:L-threonine dehydratase n=1 Tax=Pseudolactococcus piscium MKFS47 TaxID=297352 RepID=A0A0D6DUM5_9LACT|nr:threonine ammonia-lyase IlvA [Lactococcus piscium]CEN27483.1 Threonine ammonia-lyase IlvA [Lactococcus piscium MKFS47]